MTLKWVGQTIRERMSLFNHNNSNIRTPRAIVKFALDILDFRFNQILITGKSSSS